MLLKAKLHIGNHQSILGQGSVRDPGKTPPTLIFPSRHGSQTISPGCSPNLKTNTLRRNVYARFTAHPVRASAQSQMGHSRSVFCGPCKDFQNVGPLQNTIHCIMGTFQTGPLTLETPMCQRWVRLLVQATRMLWAGQPRDLHHAQITHCIWGLLKSLGPLLGTLEKGSRIFWCI